MSKKIVPIKYTSRDFDSIRNDLLNYAKRYYADTIKDFTENSFNSFMFDSVAYVGDILSYYLDYQANECFLPTSIQYSNVIKIGEELGYKFSNTIAASQGVVALYCAIPNNSSGGPDLNYNPILRKGSVFSSQDGKIFTLMEDVKMYVNGKSQITENRTGDTIEYAVKTYGKVISGRVFEKKYSIGEFKKFLKLNLEDPNVTEVISVHDEDGNEYFEVDYLSQNVIYREMPNISADSTEVPSIMRLYSVPRRFIVKKSQNTTILIFGGSSSNAEKDFKDALVEPSTFILNIENKKYFSDKSLDPNSLIDSDKLGIGPANTTITVYYRTNNFSSVNVGTQLLNRVVNAVVDFETSELVSSKRDAVIQSFEVENEDPILGSVELPTVDELKIRIKDNFSAQNRAVTLRDYESLSYSMPLKYGAVKRVRVLKDIDSFKRNLNMYILSEDVKGNFTYASDSLKNNLKLWLNNNKMVLDTIDILDAKIINLKINFKIVGNTKYQKSDILFVSKQAIINLFKRKPEIGEPLLIGDIHTALRKLDQVADIIDVEILQKTGTEYSGVYFDIDQNLSDDGRYLTIPFNAVYEIKNLQDNINGVIL